MNRAEVDERMLWSAVRYALGRSTFIVQATADELRSVWPALTDKAKHGIRRDITDWLDKSTPEPFGLCDIYTWQRSITWADQQETPSPKETR